MVNIKKYLSKYEIGSLDWVNFFKTVIPKMLDKELEMLQQFFDISTESALKLRFQSQSMFDFKYNTEDESINQKKSPCALIPLDPSYLCEFVFIQ